MQDIPLHDIKPLVDVPDNSLMMLVILSVITLLLILVPLSFWLWKKFKKKKEVNLKKVYLSKIHEINTKNAKQAAYEISEYARYIVQTDNEIALLRRLEAHLEQYKYKKTVESLDEETLACFKELLEVVDAT